MYIVIIILLLTTIVLAIMLYQQRRASKEQSQEGDKLLNAYQKRVDEQEKLQNDYRDLEKNFDNIGEGYEQALLMFDKVEENNRVLESVKNKLEEQNAELMKQKTQFAEQLRTLSAQMMPVVGNLQKDITSMLLSGGKLDAKMASRMARAASKLSGMALMSANDESPISSQDNIQPEQIAKLAVEQSGIAMVNYLKFDQQVSPIAASMMVLTNLQQAANALTELLDNSMKFATDGRVTLRVDIDDSSTKLIFTVEDTGSGIPVAEAEHVFEKGVRLNNYFDGDGMGLTVARSIARRMGGDLILDTSYVGGTRFVMTLPI